MKTKSLFFAFLFVITNCPLSIFSFSQSSNWQWVQKNSNSYTGNAIAMDKTGKIYVAGDYYDHIITPHFNGAHLSKYDQSGDVIWVRLLGGQSGSDNVYGICSDDSDNIYLVGGFSNTGTFGNHTLTARGLQDVFVAKYNPSGLCIWAKSIGANNNIMVHGWSIAFDNLNGLFLTGTYAGNTYFDSILLTTTQAKSNIFIAKYDLNGTCLWAKGMGADNCNDEGYSVKADKFGNAYIAGYFDFTAVFDNFTLTTSGLKDIFLAKYDSNGSCTWAKKFGGTADDVAYSIGFDALNNLYVSMRYKGTIITFDTISIQHAGPSNLFLTKFDTQGKCLSAKNLENVGAFQMYTDEQGFNYFAGAFSGTVNWGNQIITAHGIEDISVAKFDNQGNLICFNTAGGNSTYMPSDRAYAVVADQLGNVFITGQCTDTSVFGNYTIFPDFPGSRKSFFAGVSMPAIVADVEINKTISDFFELYPNPTCGKFVLKNNGELLSNHGEIKIYNVFGEKNYSSKINLAKTEIDLSNQPNGIYFIQLKSEKGIVVKKLIIQK